MKNFLAVAPLPKRKLTKARRGKRRSHLHLTPINLAPCPQCRRLRLPHQVCPYCGFYQGRQVLEIKPPKKK